MNERFFSSSDKASILLAVDSLGRARHVFVIPKNSS